MSLHALDPAAFKAQFVELSALSDAQVQAYGGMASAYLDPNDGPLISGPALQLALSLMAAHLAKSFLMIGDGQTAVVVAGSAEGSVSVSLVAPPVKGAWQWWLATTPYGQQLWALLQIQSAGGLYVGGSMERAAFRKAGGVF